MKSLINCTIALVFLLMISIEGNAQCLEFARKISKQELQGFVHDGNFNGVVLTEGEEAELQKTFYKNQLYRIVVCGEELLPPIRFKVLDLDRNLLFDSANVNFPRRWDFKFEDTRTLVVSIEVQKEDSTREEMLSGCVAVLFGLGE